MNGRGSGYVEWSSDTCASFMASSRLDCVFGVVRLISSARMMLVNSGPGLNTNSLVFGSHTETPSTSDGSMSEVNWIRWNSAPIERASAAASVVLPTPGTSSMSRWPRARSPTTAKRTEPLFPTSARLMLSSSRWMRSAHFVIGLLYYTDDLRVPSDPVCGYSANKPRCLYHIHVAQASGPNPFIDMMRRV